MNTMKRELTFSYAAFVMGVCFAFIMIPAAVFGVKIHVMFVLSWLIAIPLCMRLGYTYKELQSGMLDFIPKCIMPVLNINYWWINWCLVCQWYHCLYYGSRVKNDKSSIFFSNSVCDYLYLCLFYGYKFRYLWDNWGGPYGGCGRHGN